METLEFSTISPLSGTILLSKPDAKRLTDQSWTTQPASQNHHTGSFQAKLSFKVPNMADSKKESNRGAADMQVPGKEFPDVNYTESATRSLKRLLGQEGLTYAELAERLAAIGVIETETSISQKIRRGTFQFAFFLQCLEALSVDELTLSRPSFATGSRRLSTR